jgi:hypothetical protein
LLIEIARMIARRRLEYENTHLKRALKQRHSFPNIISKSDRMVKLPDVLCCAFEQAQAVTQAATTRTVFADTSARSNRKAVPTRAGTRATMVIVSK